MGLWCWSVSRKCAAQFLHRKWNWNCVFCFSWMHLYLNLIARRHSRGCVEARTATITGTAIKLFSETVLIYFICFYDPMTRIMFILVVRLTIKHPSPPNCVSSPALTLFPLANYHKNKVSGRPALINVFFCFVSVIPRQSGSSLFIQFCVSIESIMPYNIIIVCVFCCCLSSRFIEEVCVCTWINNKSTIWVCCC